MRPHCACLVYSMQSTFDHTASSLQAFSYGDNNMSLENVQVKLIRDANIFVLRNSLFTLSA